MKLEVRKKKIKEVGITLIALVVTIVILLILVGITLSTILGDNGLIKKAQQAINNTQKSYSDEKIALNQLEQEMQKEIAKIKDPSPGELEKINENEYEINSIEDLVALSNKINSEEETYDGKIINLKETMDFKDDRSYADAMNTQLFGDYNKDGITEGIMEELSKGTGFIPIGNQAKYNSDENKIMGNKFQGTFNGNNKEIRNVFVNVTEDRDTFGIAGIFGTNGEKSNIKDLGISGDIKCTNNVENGKTYIGGISGYNFGSISNCYNKCSLTNGKSYMTYIGGISGASNAPEKNIENCINGGNVHGDTTTSYIFEGGIVGYNFAGTINKGKNEINLTTSNINGGAIHTGGIAGCNYGDILNSQNTNEITSDESNESTFAGGIIGKNYGKIENCESKSVITAKNSRSTSFGNFAGGIAGESSNTGTILNCSNLSPVVIEGDIAKDGYLGGITGKNSGIIKNTNNKAKVTCKSINLSNLFLGGITGANDAGTIENAENNGELLLEENVKSWLRIGGIAGNLSSESILKLCKNTSNISINIDGGYPVIGGIAGVSTQADIQKCVNFGEIYLKENNSAKSTYTGGIVGYCGTNSKEKNILESANYGKITIEGGEYIYCGGIMGFASNNSADSCYNIGNITTKNNSSWVFTGGIMGYNSNNTILGKINKCYNYGEVNSTGPINVYSAGIAGYNYDIVTNSYNVGKINAKTTNTSNNWAYSGGICAINSSGTVSNCYNTGKIEAFDSTTNTRIRRGGIVSEQGSGTTRNSYYTSASSPYGLEQNNTGVAENIIVNDNMPTILQAIGSPFKENQNNPEYPILSWQ